MTRVAGLDIGSTATKCVMMEDGRVIASVVVPSMPDMRVAAERALRECGAEGIPVLTTGYGRALYEARLAQVSEITALAAGVGFVAPVAATVVDIGGQDSKVVRVEAGKVVDFAMNDRCAAGTGRFLEVMSRVLHIPFEEFDAVACDEVEPLPVTSTCTVFAESEVVGLLSARHPPARILKGVLTSVCGRVASLGRQVGVKAPVVATGGTMYSQAVVRALSNALGVPVAVPAAPQFVTATGAALLCARRVAADVAAAAV
jgi:predicted CoA-substrate-specific enzyme activase